VLTTSGNLTYFDTDRYLSHKPKVRRSLLLAWPYKTSKALPTNPALLCVMVCVCDGVCVCVCVQGELQLAEDVTLYMGASAHLDRDWPRGKPSASAPTFFSSTTPGGRVAGGGGGFGPTLLPHRLCDGRQQRARPPVTDASLGHVFCADAHANARLLLDCGTRKLYFYASRCCRPTPPVAAARAEAPYRAMAQAASKRPIASVCTLRPLSRCTTGTGSPTTSAPIGRWSEPGLPASNARCSMRPRMA
jgi:hypothetical protein